MRRNSHNFGDHRLSGDAGDVRVETLDALLGGERPGLVWADIQGYEVHLLRGGAETFAKGVPTALEVWPSGFREAGASAGELAEMARAWWDAFWLMRGARLVRYPIAALQSLFDELSGMPLEEDFTNVLFTRG
jgi:hypothetical protein